MVTKILKRLISDEQIFSVKMATDNKIAKCQEYSNSTWEKGLLNESCNYRYLLEKKTFIRESENNQISNAIGFIILVQVYVSFNFLKKYRLEFITELLNSKYILGMNRIVNAKSNIFTGKNPLFIKGI